MKPNRLARMIRPGNGQFTKWRKGEIVLARHVIGSSYCIEKVKWRKPKLPLFNSCVGVPRRSFEFLTYAQNQTQP